MLSVQTMLNFSPAAKVLAAVIVPPGSTLPIAEKFASVIAVKPEPVITVASRCRTISASPVEPDVATIFVRSWYERTEPANGRI